MLCHPQWLPVNGFLFASPLAKSSFSNFSLYGLLLHNQTAPVSIDAGATSFHLNDRIIKYERNDVMGSLDVTFIVRSTGEMVTKHFDHPRPLLAIYLQG